MMNPEGEKPLLETDLSSNNDKRWSEGTPLEKALRRLGTHVPQMVQPPTTFLDSFVEDELAEAFVSRFITNSRKPKEFDSLMSMRMKDMESLKNYSSRYWEVYNEDAFQGYHQIALSPEDREKTAFITPLGIYCYKVMPFRSEETLAPHINEWSPECSRIRIGKTMEIYIDDMVVKSFMVSHRGIEVNPDQIKAIQELRASRTHKEVQRLTGMTAALNRTAIKGQILVDFVAEFTPTTGIRGFETKQRYKKVRPKTRAWWKIYVDGASNARGFRNRGCHNYARRDSRSMLDGSLRPLPQRKVSYQKQKKGSRDCQKESCRDFGYQKTRNSTNDPFQDPIFYASIPDVVEDLLFEIHEGICGSHTGGRSLAHRALTQGYWWPYMQKDAVTYVKKCDKCQRFSHSVHQPAAELLPLVSPWPFAQWGMDLVGPLPRATGNRRWLIVRYGLFHKVG
uniref:Integrase zinc-binding domain-containing protein n=1 Tax=Fagus sylvatica TaxID=28930 RepID=A0A2N9J0F6_FAGSY